MMRNIILIMAVVLSAPTGMRAATAAVSTAADSLSSSFYVQPDSIAHTRPRRKAEGFRIQLYSGSNGRKSKMEAYRMGEISKTFFPELSVYCRYKEPRWICRVGDFPTMDAAQRYLKLMRQTNQFMECHIVKSTISVPVHSSTFE